MTAAVNRDEGWCSWLEAKVSDNAFLKSVCQLNDKVEDAFAWLGLQIGKYPLYFLITVITILFGLSFGLAEFEIEKDIRNLWTPRDSPTHDELKFINEYWASTGFGTITLIAVDMDDRNKDLLHESYFQEWMEIILTIHNHSPDYEWPYTWTNHTSGETEERTSTWNLAPDRWKEPLSTGQISALAGEPIDGYASEIVPFCRPFAVSPVEAQFQLSCYLASIIDCFAEGGFHLPYENYLAKTILSALAPDNPYKYRPSFIGMSSVELGAVLGPSCQAWIGITIPRNMIWGGERRVSDELDAATTEIKAFQLAMFLDNDMGIYRKRAMLKGNCVITGLLSVDCPIPSDRQLWKADRMMYKYLGDWIDWMLDFIDEWHEDDDHHLDMHFWTSRSGRDLLRAAGQADFGLLAAAYISMIVFAGLSFFNPYNLFLSRSEASACGVLIVLCSVVATFGVGSLVLKFSPNVIQVLPFIALGFGVDDMFVILSSFYFDKKVPVEEMTSEALKVAGSSVALTSLSNFLAFLIASFMPLPDVARFATVGMVVVALNWFAVVFGFTAVLALTAGRMKQGRNDCGCLVCYKLDCTKAENVTSEKPPHDHESMFDPLFDWLTQDSVRMCMMFAFVVLACVGAYGTTLVKVGLPIADIIPENSYAQGYMALRERYFHTLPTTLYSDGKLDNQRSQHWETSFETWIDTTKQVTSISKFIDPELDAHGFWAWSMQSYYAGLYATYYGSDGFTPARIQMPGASATGRSSDCETDRMMFCPSLAADYSYGSNLFNCLSYNTGALTASCQAYLDSSVPASPGGGIARQMELTHVYDSSVNGVYMMPADDTSDVYYRADGAVLYQRADLSWMLLDSVLTPLYYSPATEKGAEPAQGYWYAYGTTVKQPMTMVIFDSIIWFLGFARDSSFLVGGLPERQTFSVTARMMAGDENEQSCFAEEIIKKLMASSVAYEKVTISTDAGDVMCDAVLEASDVCHGFATGERHGAINCGSVEATSPDAAGQWWAGNCSDDYVIASHPDTAITEGQACTCSATTQELTAGTTVLSMCSPNFGGFGLANRAECNMVSQDVVMTCEALPDCLTIKSCYEFVHESAHEYCTGQAIERVEDHGSLGLIGRCLLPQFAMLDSCCQEAVKTVLFPEYDCPGFANAIGSDADELSAVCSQTDACDDTCTQICTGYLANDCYEDIGANCQTEWDSGVDADFTTCMDGATLGTCCAATYAVEGAMYANCLIPVMSYWDYTDDEYDYSLCSDGDTNSSSCGPANVDSTAQLDCMIAAVDSLTGCCARAIGMIDNTNYFTRECEGDVARYCLPAGEQHAADMDEACETAMADLKMNEPAQLSANCLSAVSTCLADGVWAESAQGTMLSEDCAAGYSGQRTRTCEAGGLMAMWGAADESACMMQSCPTVTTDGQMWESIPVFNVRSLFNADLTNQYGVGFCTPFGAPSALRSCNPDGSGGVEWSSPDETAQCRSVFGYWYPLADDQACDPRTSSMLFAFDMSPMPFDVGFGACKSICSQATKHCYGFEVLYDNDGNQQMCIGYDFCEFVKASNDSMLSGHTYKWQAGQMAMAEFVATQCALESPSTPPSMTLSPTGIPHPDCFNIYLWQYMVDPAGGGVLKRNSFIVNNQSYLFGTAHRFDLRIVTTSNSIMLVEVMDDEDAVDFLMDLRKAMKNEYKPRGLYIIPSGPVVVVYTQYIGVEKNLFENLGYVSISIILTGTIFLLHPVAVFSVLLCDFAMLLEIYGFADWLGLRINGVLALNIVIAVGLTMEFTAHMARAFMLSESLDGEKIGLPSATEAQIRLKKTYREMFTPVTLGAITTVIGVAPISAASFPYFRQYYFVLYVFIVLFGWVNGVIFMPILLSLVNPHPWAQDEERKQTSRMTLMEKRKELQMETMGYEEDLLTSEKDTGKADGVVTAADTTSGDGE